MATTNNRPTTAQSNGLHMPELNPENEKIYCVYDPKILERARKYQTRRGLSNVQNVLRLALSYFLDKEGV